jgi:NhaP-type Na+/H+ and K+/H+ antiporter
MHAHSLSTHNLYIMYVYICIHIIYVGIICMLVGYAYSKMVDVTAVNTTMLTSLGFFSGFLMFTLTMKVVSSAVATVYVCFAENPTIFEETHPALYRFDHTSSLIISLHFDSSCY